MLARESVHLVIMLCTDKSPGALVELGSFVHVPRIRDKTIVLFPEPYFKPKLNVPANTAAAFRQCVPYSWQQLEVCDVVEECLDLARKKAYEESVPPPELTVWE